MKKDIINFLNFLLFFLATPFTFAHNTPYYSHNSAASGHHSDWMGTIPGTRDISDMSLPGTHDTMLLYGGDIAQTQSMALDDQLTSGIRVLDIRCRRVDNKFMIYHGFINQYKNFDDVLLTVTHFLRLHPTETVLMRVKEESTPTDSNMSFAEIFNRYANDSRYSDYFWKENVPSPTLDMVRGKIIIMNSVSDVRPWYNSFTFYVQDDYTVSTNWELYDKWTAIKNQLIAANKSHTNNNHAIYMNYLSASTGSFPYFVASGHSNNATGAPRLSTGLTTPGWKYSFPDFPRVNCFIDICTIAFEGTNILTANFIKSAHLEYVGIIMVDFPGPGLIEQIITLNQI